MKTQKHIALICISSLLFASSCQKDVVLDLSNTQGEFVVVDANINNDGNQQWIRLSRSTSFYEVSEGIMVSDAFVSVSDGLSTWQFIESEVDSLKGYYFNNQISEFLKDTTYTLMVETDEEVYSATSQMRFLPSLDSVSLAVNFFTQLGFTEDTLYDVFVHFPEDKSVPDYYLFDLWINDSIATSRPTDKSLVSDENLQEYVSFSIFNISQINLEPGDTITVEMKSISEENFDFYQVFFFQTDLSGNPFAGAPPANIPSNISNGGKGFFQVSAVQRQSLIYKPLE